MTRWRGEVCKNCGRRNVIGFVVDDEVWADVTVGFPFPPDAAPVLCPACFDELAEARGVRYEFKAVYPVTWNDWEVTQ